MKSARNFTATIIFALAAASCAPVTSSVPKLASQTPRPGDSLSATGTSDVRIRSSNTQVIAADIYSSEEDKVSQDYRILKLKRDELNSFLTDRKVSVPLSVGATRMDVIVLVEVSGSDKGLKKDLSEQLDVTVLRDEKLNDRFWISVTDDKTSPAVWAYLKKRATGVSLAYREVEIK